MIEAAIGALEALYAALPTIACKGLCHESCGPILMSEAESARLQAAGHLPGANIATLTCAQLGPMEADGGRRCQAYALRPMICRLWGLVRSMACHHGCVPSRWLTDEECTLFLRMSLVLGGHPTSETKAAILNIAARGRAARGIA